MGNFYQGIPFTKSAATGVIDTSGRKCHGSFWICTASGVVNRGADLNSLDDY
jgi:hypothetical protein